MKSFKMFLLSCVLLCSIEKHVTARSSLTSKSVQDDNNRRPDFQTEQELYGTLAGEINNIKADVATLESQVAGVTPGGVESSAVSIAATDGDVTIFSGGDVLLQNDSATISLIAWVLNYMSIFLQNYEPVLDQTSNTGMLNYKDITAFDENLESITSNFDQTGTGVDLILSYDNFTREITVICPGAALISSSNKAKLGGVAVIFTNNKVPYDNIVIQWEVDGTVRVSIVTPVV